MLSHLWSGFACLELSISAKAEGGLHLCKRKTTRENSIASISKPPVNGWRYPKKSTESTPVFTTLFVSYREHTRFHDAFRKRHQSHGQCVCPKNKFWLCDADCLTCEFRRAGDHISLDYTTENEDGDTCSPLDALADTAPSIEDVICDKAELDQLFARLNELMPEAQDIGKLRQKGLTDEAIAEVIGIKRTTFRSRLAKAKKQLAAEFPDRF